MSGLSMPTLEFIFHAATYAAFILGGLGVTAALISGFSGYEVADRLQKASDEKIAEWNERAEALKKGNLELQTNLEKERSARLTLEAKLAPRRLSESDMKALIAALKPFKGQKCIVSYALGNAESDKYADDFVKVLDAAGWNHNGPNGIQGSIWNTPIFGIQITVPQGAQSSEGTVTPGILALIKEMRKLGLTEGPSEFFTDPALPIGIVDIRIGSK